MGEIAIRSATFTIGGVDIRCHVLESGKRVIDANDLEAFFENADRVSPEEVEKFMAWVTKQAGEPDND